MVLIRQLLQEKGNQVWTVDTKATVIDALKLMAEKGIGAVLVMDGERIEGIFSERDFARGVVTGECCFLEKAITDLMTGEVYCVSPDSSVEECMALMTSKRFRHLPVVAGGKLAGLISIGDIVKADLSEKEVAIRSLENYILGREYSG